MDLFKAFDQKLRIIIEELVNAGELPAGLDLTGIKVEPPRDKLFGDITTNAAMVLANLSQKKPRDLAALMLEKLEHLEDLTKVEIAGPGFLNMTLSLVFWQERLRDVLSADASYGNSNLGAGKKINVEFISANPTGPLHVAHARGAVTGDVLANLLVKVGYKVTKEYYINDAGSQIDVLARSLYFRYCEILGENIGEMSIDFYPGDYLKRIAEELIKRDEDKWLYKDESFWLKEFKEFATRKIMKGIRADLNTLGINQEVFTSESSLVQNGAVDEVLKKLEKENLVYKGILEPPKGRKPDDWEPRPQTLFKATQFGDDIDRPLKKSDGTWTYFANDIAYHYDKYKRGFNVMINIFGADHGGYVKRMVAATAAISSGKAELDIQLCQMVHLRKGGRSLRMSKRSGNFITLRELISEVGKDVVRFIMLTRKNDTQMDFDLEKALDQSRDNPVFYVQYAHARCFSIFKNAHEDFTAEQLTTKKLIDAPLHLLIDPAEIELIKTISSWPRVIESAAEAHEPHRIAYYLNELANNFHTLWNKGSGNNRLRFIDRDKTDITLARLALVKSVALTIVSAFAIFGVEPLDELH